MLTRGILPAFRGGVHFFIYTANRHRASPKFIRSRNCVPIDGVYCRESAGIGSVVFKVAPVTGAAFSGITMDQIICASLFPRKLLVCSSVHVRHRSYRRHYAIITSQTRKRAKLHHQRGVNSPVLSTCPLHTNSGCGKERRILIGP